MNKPVSPTERLSIEAVLRMGSTRAGGLKLWYLVAAGFIALLLVLWLVVGSPATSTKYLTDAASRGTLTVIVTATGSVQPTNQVDVSSELSGIVRNVLVDYNSPVKIGQVLAELDTDKLKATVDSSRAKLDAAKAKVAEAEETVIEKEEDYNRKASLVEKHITSTLNFEVARALFRRAQAVRESARADVAVAEADLNLNETNLAKAAIRSPINGVVLARNVDPGQTVASSFQAPVLFSIAEDLTQMEIQVDVDEADVGKVKEGQKATFTVDAYPDRKFQAEIRELQIRLANRAGCGDLQGRAHNRQLTAAASARDDGDGGDLGAAHRRRAPRCQCRTALLAPERGHHSTGRRPPEKAAARPAPIPSRQQQGG